MISWILNLLCHRGTQYIWWLGSSIAEYKATLKSSPKQLFIGINDKYSKGGSYKFLQEKHGLTYEKIVNEILKNYKKLNGK